MATTKAEPRRVGIVRLSYRMLQDFLGFSEEHHILGLNIAKTRGGSPVVEIKVEGPNMPEVSEGEAAPWVTFSEVLRRPM